MKIYHARYIPILLVQCGQKWRTSWQLVCFIGAIQTQNTPQNKNKMQQYSSARPGRYSLNLYVEKTVLC